MRLGNVIVPNASYGEIIEAMVMPALEEIREERLQSTGKTGADAWIGFGSIHLVWALGEKLGTPDTLIHWAWKTRSPYAFLELQMVQSEHNCLCLDKSIAISTSIP